MIIYPEQRHGFLNKQPFMDETLLVSDKFLISLEWLTGPPALNQGGGHARVNGQ